MSADPDVPPPDQGQPPDEPPVAGAEDAAPSRRFGPEPPRRKFSEILMDVAAGSDKDTISIGDILQAMEARAIGALMLVFAFPNILPSPPGLAGVLGLPLVYLSSQMMLRQRPWLPGFIANRSLKRESFTALVNRASPWLGKAERMLKQRVLVLTSAPAQAVLGGICLVLSLLLILPVPFANLMPALAIAILSLGILERDGYWVIAGLIAAVGAAGWVGALGYTLVKTTVFVWINAL